MEATVRQRFDHFVLIWIKILVVNFLKIHTVSFWAADSFFRCCTLKINFVRIYASSCLLYSIGIDSRFWCALLLLRLVKVRKLCLHNSGYARFSVVRWCMALVFVLHFLQHIFHRNLTRNIPFQCTRPKLAQETHSNEKHLCLHSLLVGCGVGSKFLTEQIYGRPAMGSKTSICFEMVCVPHVDKHWPGRSTTMQREVLNSGAIVSWF